MLRYRETQGHAFSPSRHHEANLLIVELDLPYLGVALGLSPESCGAGDVSNGAECHAAFQHLQKYKRKRHKKKQERPHK
jgi:hypothetical protein